MSDTQVGVNPDGSAATPVKSGWLTSEHLLMALVTLLVTLEGSGLVPVGTGWDKGIVMAIQLLGALGYTAARTYLKAAS